MTNVIFKSTNDEAIFEKLTWNEKWQGNDNGLIACWEQGKKLALADKLLIDKVKNEELPMLPWKGGFEKKLKNNSNKFAPYHYLAMWQGIRGDDLNIDIATEIKMTCSRTGMTSVFTIDHEKYENG